MTVYHHDGHPVMCDGGTEPRTVTKTVRAKEVVTREVDGDDVDMLRVPISSTRSDREGDRFSKGGLEDMAEQVREEQPMVFDNHGLAGGFMDAIPYDSRETIGAQMDAEVEQADDGEYELYSYINPDGTHPEGERMLQQLADENQPLKYSVGFRVLSYDEIQDDAGNEIGREFTEADLMETSRVGIPANSDASATQDMSAAKDIGELGELPGYKNHPLFQMMMGGGQEATATKSAGPDAGRSDDGDGEKVEGGCEMDSDCPDGEVCVEGECIPEDELDAGDDGDTKQDTCPECGEDVPADANYCPHCGEELGNPGDDDGGDDDDEGDTEEDSDIPEHIREMRENQQALRKEVASIREDIQDEGDAKTGDTSMQDTTAQYPDETDDEDGDGDSTEQKDTDESAGKPLTERMR